MQACNAQVNKILLIYYILIPILSFMRRGKSLRIGEFFLSMLLVIFGLAVSRWGSSVQIFMSVIIGTGFLIITIIMTSPRCLLSRRSLLGILHIPGFIICKPNISIRILLANIQEELIWRAAFVHLMMPLFGDIFLTVAAGATIFYIIHLPVMRPVVIAAHIEFVLFSILLYVFYIQTFSIIAVCLIHFIRNIYIRVITLTEDNN